MLLEANNEKSGGGKRGRGVPKPPDGGWGWWVVLASFLIHVVADGVAYTFGLFFVKISEDLEASKSATSWIASIMAGMTYGVGPIAGAVVNKFGCRAVSIVGSVIAAFGFAISYFAQSLAFLYISIGIIGGLGLGLIYLPAIVCVTCYFEKRRAFATGIAVCGSGFGTFILAPCIEMLIRAYGWRFSLIVTGGIILTCFFFSLFFRPLEDDGEDGSEADESLPTIMEPEPDEASEVISPLMMDNNKGIMTPNQPKKPSHLLLINNDTLTMSCSQPALRLVADSTDSLPRMGGGGETAPANGGPTSPNFNLHAKRHSLKTVALASSPTPFYGSRPALTPNNSQGVILQRKDIFYSGSLMKLPTTDAAAAGTTTTITATSNGALRMKSNSRSHIQLYLSQYGDKPPLPTTGVYGDTVEENVEDDEEDGMDDDDRSEVPTSTFSELKKVIRAMADLSLLKDPIFLFFALSNFFTSIGYNVPYIYLVDKAIGDASNPKNNDQDAAFLLSIVGISNTLSRVVLGYLSDKPWVNRLYMYNIALAMCGIATGLCSHTDNINLLRVYSATFGSTVGVYVSLTSVILVDLLGLEKLTNAFGLLLLFQGVATVIGPPIVGFLFDRFGDYRYGFWLAGGMIALSGLMLFFIPLIRTRQERKLAALAVPKDESDFYDAEGTNHEHIIIHCSGEKGKKGSNNNLRSF